jgi:hypothetical protein
MRSQTLTRGSAFILALFGIGAILALLSYFLYHNPTQIFFDIINFVRNYPIQAGIIFFIGLVIGWALGHPSY